MSYIDTASRFDRIACSYTMVCAACRCLWTLVLSARLTSVTMAPTQLADSDCTASKRPAFQQTIFNGNTRFNCGGHRRIRPIVPCLFGAGESQLAKRKQVWSCCPGLRKQL